MTCRSVSGDIRVWTAAEVGADAPASQREPAVAADRLARRPASPAVPADPHSPADVPPPERGRRETRRRTRRLSKSPPSRLLSLLAAGHLHRRAAAAARRTAGPFRAATRLIRCCTGWALVSVGLVAGQRRPSACARSRPRALFGPGGDQQRQRCPWSAAMSGPGPAVAAPQPGGCPTAGSQPGLVELALGHDDGGTAQQRLADQRDVEFPPGTCIAQVRWHCPRPARAGCPPAPARAAATAAAIARGSHHGRPCTPLDTGIRPATPAQPGPPRRWPCPGTWANFEQRRDGQVVGMLPSASTPRARVACSSIRSRQLSPRRSRPVPGRGSLAPRSPR